MSDDNDERLTDIEMTLAHQEQTIHELSDLVHKQWDEIERLKRLVQRLDETKADADPSDEADRRPPHY